MQIKLSSPIQSDSIVDGEGIRTVVWTQGCVHKCPGCHNPDTWSFDEGTMVLVEDVINEIGSLKHQDGVTFSGGEPMSQVSAVTEIAKFCKKQGLNVWCYTGYTFEELWFMSFEYEKLRECMKYIDILVDGRYNEEEKSLDLIFRGSRNQRILNMKASLKKGSPVLVGKYSKKNKQKKEKLFVYE